jgi:hypothetical protein
LSENEPETSESLLQQKAWLEQRLAETNSRLQEINNQAKK